MNTKMVSLGLGLMLAWSLQPAFGQKEGIQQEVTEPTASGGVTKKARLKERIKNLKQKIKDHTVGNRERIQGKDLDLKTRQRQRILGGEVRTAKGTVNGQEVKVRQTTDKNGNVKKMTAIDKTTGTKIKFNCKKNPEACKNLNFDQ